MTTADDLAALKSNLQYATDWAGQPLSVPNVACLQSWIAAAAKSAQALASDVAPPPVESLTPPFATGALVSRDKLADLSNWNPFFGPGVRWDDLGQLPSPLSGSNNPNGGSIAFYDPANAVLLSGGGVSLNAQVDASQSKLGYSWRSACLTSKTTLPRTGWVVGVRAKLPVSTGGGWGAIWFLGTNSAQEFDGVETGWTGQNPDSQEHSDLFAGPGGQQQKVWPVPFDASADFHNYWFVFDPAGGKVQVFAESTKVDEVDLPLVDEDYYLWLQLQIAGPAYAGWHTTGGTQPISMEVLETAVYALH